MGDVDKIALSDRQRDRIEEIKSECAGDHLPEPSDSAILDSLLDTWDAVGEGLYTTPYIGESERWLCRECGWDGPSGEVDYSFSPPGQDMFHPECQRWDCPECGESLPPEPLQIGDYKVRSLNHFMYSVDGISTNGDGCGFRIRLDRSFGDRLKDLDVPNRQSKFREFIRDTMLDGMFSDVRLAGDSFFLTNITVDGNATGLDLTNSDDFHVYHTHNVDTTHQAVDIIAVFSKWVELSHHVLTDESIWEESTEGGEDVGFDTINTYEYEEHWSAVHTALEQYLGRDFPGKMVGVRYPQQGSSDGLIRFTFAESVKPGGDR